MKGVSKYYTPGIVDVKALLAGNDILLFSENVPEAINQIKIAISNGDITQEEVNDRCRKVLIKKYWMGLSKFKPINIEKVKNEIIVNNTHLINRKLVENSITVLQNYNNLIPLKRLDTLNIASVSIGKSSDVFQATLSKYAKISHYKISENASEKQKQELLLKLSKYNLVLVGVHKSYYHGRVIN